MSVGMKMSLFALVTVALAAMPCQSEAQLYEGSNGWFAGGPVGYTAYRPLVVPTTAYYGGGCSTCATPVVVATPVAVTAYRPGPFAWFRGWFQRPVTVVGYAPTVAYTPSCCGSGIAAPAIAAPACEGGCAAPSLAAYAPTTTAYYAPPASSCCGGGVATTANYPAPAATNYYQPAPAASPALPANNYPAASTPAGQVEPAPAANPSPTSIYATPQSLAPAAASSTEGNASPTAEPKTLRKEETTAPPFNAPLKPVPQGKTNIKGGLFQGPALVDPEDRTTQRPTGHFAVKQAVLLQPAKASSIRPSDTPTSDPAPLDTEGWRPARAR